MHFRHFRKVKPVVVSLYSDVHRWKAVARPLLMALAVAAGVSSAPAQSAAKPASNASFGKVQLNFEPNRGQVDGAVQYLSRGPGYSLYLTPGEAVLQLQKGKQATTLQMTLVGADKAASVIGKQPLSGTVNYFVGSDSSKWHTAVPTFGMVSYTAVYPGVDLVYYGNQRELEYDFVVAPGADAAKIALQFTGAEPVIDKAGDLVLSVQGEEARFHKPVVYQLGENGRANIDASYQIADGKVQFALGAYDHTKTLVIDPVLSYMTYLGGNNDEMITGMAVDAQGNVIVVGTTYSTNFPIMNAYDSVPGQAGNYPHTMFVSKFNSTGTALVYSTYLGDSTVGAAVAIDPSGNAYAFGTTNDPNYPVTPGAFQTICGANNDSQGNRTTGCSKVAASGNNGMVVTKISPAGSQLVYSTFLGGTNGNTAQAIAVNAAGEAYVTGVTNAVCPGPYNSNGTGYQAYFCIPVTANASEPANNSGANADTYGFLVKFNAQGSGLLYSTVIGNHNPVGHSVSGMKANAIALDTAGNAYITGNMDSNYVLKTTPGALQTVSVAGSLPAFVAKFDPAGTAATSLVYSTYLSGTTHSNDNATGIAVDASGNAVVTGYTDSCTFPTTPGSFSPIPGGYISQNVCSGGFLTKLNAAGSGLVWSTYTGNQGANGRNNDNNDAVALGPDGSVYVAGDEQGVALSPTVNPILPQMESHFAYIKHFTANGSSVVFSSAIGGTTDATSVPTAIVVDPSNQIYLAGYTNSASWPTTPGAFQKTSANPNDGFIVKIAPTFTTTTAITLPTGTVTAGQSVNLTAKVTGQTGSTGTPTGTITFLSGNTTLGTGTLDSTGTATYTAPSLNATTYSVTASYPGDSLFAASVSAAQALVVAPAAATVTVTAPATATPGMPVTLSVQVTGTPGTPTGSVTFKDGATTLSTVVLASGAATYTSTAFAIGTHSLTASYTGDSIFGSGTSVAQTLTVSLATPAITLTAPGTALVGTSVALSASVTSTSGTPTGSVTFKDGSAVLSTVTLASGAASYATSALAVGSHTITATYSGDATFSAVTSANSTVTISVAPAITFAAAPASLTVPHGSSTTTMIVGTPVGGYTGTVTFACGTLPAGASCTFAPTSLVFTGNNTAASTTLTFATSITTTGALRPLFGTGSLGGVLMAVLLAPFMLRRKNILTGGRLLLWVVFAGSIAVLGLSGCSGSKAATTITTAPGAYTVPVLVTAGGTTSTVNVSITVQ